jgi:hypothetical protein
MSWVYSSGGRVTHSGLYLAIHARQHADTHYVTAVCGDIFPACVECADQVEFRLAISAAHLSVHPHFKASDKRKL